MRLVPAEIQGHSYRDCAVTWVVGLREGRASMAFSYLQILSVM